MHATLEATTELQTPIKTATQISYLTAPAGPLGRVLVAATEKGICSLLLGDTDKALLAWLAREFPSAIVTPAADRTTSQLLKRTLAAVTKNTDTADLPLDLHGTAFQQRVWSALRTIPRGQTRSYGQIAKQIGSPAAVRAVGTACGKNPVAIIIPCHRVLRGTGGLGGFACGLHRKVALLQREGITLAS